MTNTAAGGPADCTRGTVAAARNLDWPACLNARDLGGLPTEGEGEIRDGASIRSDRHSCLTRVGIDAVQRIAASRIIDLRAPHQCEREPSPFAGTDLYRNVPLSDPADAPDRQPRLVARYLSKLDHNLHRFAQVVATVADAPLGAVVVRCEAGKDRTGLVVALILGAVGVPNEAIAANYAVSARADTMLSTLTHLHDQYGGVVRYLRCGGLSRTQLDVLRERLVDQS